MSIPRTKLNYGAEPEINSHGSQQLYNTDGLVLSVVVAAYNIEKYIAECMLSVLSQLDSSDAVELIVIVDGATDSTLTVAKETARQYNRLRVKVIHQTNAGLSGARNTGLEIASGEYVTFLDGDDFWLPGYLKCIFRVLSSSKPDIVEYDALMTREDGTPDLPLKIALASSGDITNIEPASLLAIFRCYSWARVYRKTLFTKYQFPTGRLFEDTSILPWLYWRASSVVSIGCPLLGYRQRQGSILKTPKINHIADLNHAALRALSMYEETNDVFWLKVGRRIFQQCCSRTTVLPFKLWPRALEIASDGLQARLPISGGLTSRLLVISPFVYTLLLYFKRQIYDRFALWRERKLYKSREPSNKICDRIKAIG